MKSLIVAKNTIYRQYDHDFSYVYYTKKLELLEERFETFKWMLGVEGLSYDMTTSVFTAPEKVWHYIFDVSDVICFQSISDYLQYIVVYTSGNVNGVTHSTCEHVFAG